MSVITPSVITPSEFTPNAFSVRTEEGIAIVSIDVAGESQNIIKAGFVDGIGHLFDQLEQTAKLKGVIFTSAKPDSFIAGADINMLASCTSAAEVTALARSGQAFCNRVADFSVPIVAAIDGVCLGGGLEFALACQGRVCSDNPKTRLGLPEVQLGLLPGSGGTQRLPRLVGPMAALDMMLTGRQLRAKQALKMGLVDQVVPASILLQAARQQIEQLTAQTPRKQRKSLLNRVLENNPLGRFVVFNQTRKRTRAKTHGNYPAPEQIINCVEYGLQRGMDTGLVFEAEKFGQLSQTPQARQLMQLYFAVTALKKDSGIEKESAVDTASKPRAMQKIAVLGAGLMGAGIAYVSSARAEVSVRLKDQNSTGLQRGLAALQSQVEKRRKRRSISPYEASQQLNRITPSIDYSGFKSVDLVIEAVFEDLVLKQQMVQDIEAHCSADTIFATNTSSIPLARVAQAAQRPECVIGMHYFSPVEKMPLLEVIAHERTAPEVIASTVKFGQRQGKTVIVVKDSAGFFVNRILAPYINEAGYLLLQGVPIETLDRALVAFGFPVGPFTLLDEVGLDVAAKVAPILQDAFGTRLQAPPLLEKLIEQGRLGKKNGQGFYRYDKKRKKADATIYEVLGITAKSSNVDELAERCVLPLLNEAARCLHEGVIHSARDGDVGAIFGIGFPPFLGGPFRYIDSLSVQTVVDRLKYYAQHVGERFAPAQCLLDMAEQNGRFYPVGSS